LYSFGETSCLVFDVDGGGFIIALVFRICFYYSIEWEFQKGFQLIMYFIVCCC
jgi:hypothetical protein